MNALIIIVPEVVTSGSFESGQDSYNSYEYQFENILPRVLPPQAVDTIERNDRKQSLESIANKTKHQLILTHMWANEYENTIQINMVECQLKWRSPWISPYGESLHGPTLCMLQMNSLSECVVSNL